MPKIFYIHSGFYSLKFLLTNALIYQSFCGGLVGCLKLCMENFLGEPDKFMCPCIQFFVLFKIATEC